ncbi:hypothetical protein C8035_v004595 [Colletotrichum spinosum]|uniref:CFEM domain-containing protein n=1 Tax=Colletotrichum spinosum TaxID=1347390 RepID=A0A4R8PXL1_9PEZI|nr:hypothetical protein C8035_v004595 [Colletotrichum spinosum]
MRLFHLIAAFIATASAASASSLTAGYPTCAVVCVLDALPQSRCSGLDQKCLCTDLGFTHIVTACVTANCTISERLAAAKGSADNCGITTEDNRALPRFLTGILFVLPTAFIIIRLVNKWANPSPWAADDTTAMIGYVCTVPLVATTYLSLEIGLGNAIWTVDQSRLTDFFKLLFITQTLYLSGLMATKASVLYFFLRIFPATGIRRVLWATLAFNYIIGVIYLGLTFGSCRPLSVYWEGWAGERESKCLDYLPLVLSHAIINLILDLWMIVLPITQLYGLHLAFKKKFGVILMFSVGFMQVPSVQPGTPTPNMFADSFQSGRPRALWVYVWTFSELCVGVFVACMPSAGQLWRSIFKKSGSSAGDARSRHASVYGAEMVSFSTENQKHRDMSVGSGTERLTQPPRSPV